MNASTADPSTRSGLVVWAHAEFGEPVSVKVPIGSEYVASVTPWEASAAGTGTDGGFDVVRYVFLCAPVATLATSVAVTRYRSGVNQRASVGQQVTIVTLGSVVL